MLALCPVMGNAAIIYRVEQVAPADTTPERSDNRSLTRDHRFYIGGSYNYSLWNDDTRNGIHADGQDTSSFDAMVGMRLYDTFRIEASYIRAQAKWDTFSLTGDIAMINAIVDARIDSLYRVFRSQRLVPYIGAGGGISWNSARHIEIDRDVTPVVSAMVGLGVEMGENFAVDFGYRYLYMFSPKFDTMDNMAPFAHQLRVGARINF